MKEQSGSNSTLMEEPHKHVYEHTVIHLFQKSFHREVLFALALADPAAWLCTLSVSLARRWSPGFDEAMDEKIDGGLFGAHSF